MRSVSGLSSIINRGLKLHNLKIMKKDKSFSMHQNQSILLSKELRTLWNSLREAESPLEFEMAMRDLERIIRRVEKLEGGQGA